MGIWNRVNRVFKELKVEWRSDSYFSKRYAIWRVEDMLFRKIGFRRLSDKAFQKRERFMITYLEACIHEVIDKNKNQSCEGEYADNAPVWVCWWTGIESAPPIVQKCINSICKNAGEHPVNIITENNYKRYITVPDYILKKMESGKMGLAHFSDYLRITLLEKYGGLWLDATIFCSKPIPEDYFHFPFFTLKSPYKESRYVSKYQWVTFCLGAWKNNQFYKFVKEAFEVYWLENDVAIDYLFFDYIILLAKQNCPYIKQLMDNVPNNELHRDDLQAAMNLKLPAEHFYDVIQEDTGLYKLSWREKYSEKTEDGAMSIYAFFLSMT